jgi:hypothetical protein
MRNNSNYHLPELAEVCEEAHHDNPTLLWMGRDDRDDGYYFVTLMTINEEILRVLTYFDREEFTEDIKAAEQDFNIEFIKQ